MFVRVTLYVVLGEKPVPSNTMMRDLETALFGQDHWLITPKLALDLGIRRWVPKSTKTIPNRFW